ncbi:MAG: hypothetical protein ACTS5R_01465 [Candidatus Hodgkinia cicadicola]
MFPSNWMNRYPVGCQSRLSAPSKDASASIVDGTPFDWRQRKLESTASNTFRPLNQEDVSTSSLIVSFASS